MDNANLTDEIKKFSVRIIATVISAGAIPSAVMFLIAHLSLKHLRNHVIITKQAEVFIMKTHLLLALALLATAVFVVGLAAILNKYISQQWKRIF